MKTMRRAFGRAVAEWPLNHSPEEPSPTGNGGRKWGTVTYFPETRESHREMGEMGDSHLFSGNAGKSPIIGFSVSTREVPKEAADRRTPTDGS